MVQLYKYSTVHCTVPLYLYVWASVTQKTYCPDIQYVCTVYMYSSIRHHALDGIVVMTITDLFLQLPSLTEAPLRAILPGIVPSIVDDQDVSSLYGSPPGWGVTCIHVCIVQGNCVIFVEDA